MTSSKHIRSICVVTATRAEYGLLRPLISAIKNDPSLTLRLVVTGAHLAPEFGLTYREIEKDGFKIDEKVESLLSSDTPVGITKSIALAQLGFAEVFNSLRPDLLVLLGDRYDILPAAIAAMIARIPIAHIHGGELTEGLVDEAIRHSITKMSLFHFAATEIYRRRIIQLGEAPDRVFNVGGLGVEAIKNIHLMSKSELESELNFKFKKRNALVTFHPVTLEKGINGDACSQLLKALAKFDDMGLIFTMPNADTEGREIAVRIQDFVSNHSSTAVFWQNLGSKRYFSALKHVDAVVGNSSSGILEAPTFKIATINIGDRQAGRIKAESVIDCEPCAENIVQAMNKVYSKDFQTILKNVVSPFGTGHASQKILEILKKASLTDSSLKKKFHDVDFVVKK